jgi:hypothetical protein
MLRLVFKELAFGKYRDSRSRNIMADFLRALNLQHAIEHADIESEIMDERCRPRRRADAIKAMPLADELGEQLEDLELCRCDAVAEARDPCWRVETRSPLDLKKLFDRAVARNG